MIQDPGKEKQDKGTTKVSKKPHAVPKKKKEEKQISSFSDVMTGISKIDVEKPKAFEELVVLFEAFRNLRDISNNQIDEFFRVIEEKANVFWTPLLAKMANSLCLSKCDCDTKIIYAIRTICKDRLEKFGIHESGLSNAERNVCLQVNGSFVTQFLKDAYKQGQKKEQQISNAELARLVFICITLYCKTAYDGDPRIQKEIDRAIAEFFSSHEISGIREKELTGKTIGNIMAAKTYSPTRLAELTYLYAGTTDLIGEQKETIKSLQEAKRNQADRIAALSNEVKTGMVHRQELQETIDALNTQLQQLTEERNAAESMLEFEKNKYELQLKARGSGLAKRLTYDIGLELETLRELVESLDPNNQRRFSRRLDSIDLYLREFGGEQ